MTDICRNNAHAQRKSFTREVKKAYHGAAAITRKHGVVGGGNLPVSPLLAPFKKRPTSFSFGDRPTGHSIICGSNHNRKA